jgi:hypothetical protein
MKTPPTNPQKATKTGSSCSIAGRAGTHGKAGGAMTKSGKSWAAVTGGWCSRAGSRNVKVVISLFIVDCCFQELFSFGS